MWQFQWPLQQGEWCNWIHNACRFLHFYTGRKATSCWCRNNHSGYCWIQQISYQPLKSQISVKIDLSLLDVLGLPPPVALWIKEENFLRFLWSLHHKTEIGGKRVEVAKHSTIHLHQFFACCVTSSIFHLGSSFIRGKVQVSDYSPFTLI